MKLNTLWTRGLGPQEKADLEQNVKNSKKELDFVRNLVYNIYVDSISISESDYDNPNWAYKKAHEEGYRKALETILVLLDLEGDDRPLTKTKRKALTDVRTELRSTRTK